MLISISAGLLEPLADLEDELRAVVPAVLRPAEDVLAVQGVEVDHVEAALVEGLGRVGGDLGQQRRVAVGHEQAEALLEVMHLGALGVCGATCVPQAPRWQPVKRVRRLLRRRRV